MASLESTAEAGGAPVITVEGSSELVYQPVTGTVPVLMCRGAPRIPFLASPPFALHPAGMGERFEQAIRGMAVAIVVVADGDENVEAWYGERAQNHPTTAFVLIARFEPSSARSIVRAGPDDVFWWPGQRDTLMNYLAPLQAPDPARVLARILALANSDTFTLSTRNVLRYLADLDRDPIPTVRDLAHRVGVGETAFRSQIRKDFRNCTAKPVIDSVICLRAVVIFASYASRKQTRLRVADAIRIDPETLDYISVRTTGKRFLKSASGVGLREGLARFGAFWQEARAP